jgi:hypothetical protein
MTTPGTVELIYARGDASADEIAAVVAEQLQSDDLLERVAAAGLDPAAVRGATIAVRERAQGLEPILTAIVIGITVDAGKGLAEAFWTKVIWPSVRRRLGARALSGRTGNGTAQ